MIDAGHPSSPALEAAFGYLPKTFSRRWQSKEPLNQIL